MVDHQTITPEQAAQAAVAKAWAAVGQRPQALAHVAAVRTALAIADTGPLNRKEPARPTLRELVLRLQIRHHRALGGRHYHFLLGRP